MKIKIVVQRLRRKIGQDPGAVPGRSTINKLKVTMSVEEYWKWIHDNV